MLSLAAGLALVPGRPGAESTASAAGNRPNIIVLLTDDQEFGSMRVMKTVNKEMKRKGVTFKRFYDNFPLCCPARTTLFTGQYAHNHGVLSNLPPDGGYGVFNERHGDNYLPLWLQAAGYRTSYIGKFENGYAEPDEYGTTPKDVPRGWDDWHVLAPSRAQYFNYILNQNGHLRHYTEAEEDYSTDVFTSKARRFIRSSAKASSPFYLELGYAAPHGGGGGDPGRSCNRAAVPAPRDLGTLRKKDKRLTPSFNEADVSDKPSPIAERPPLTPGQINDILRKRRCAWESLLAVDDSVGAILDEIHRDGIRRNTYVFYLSDNGFLFGEHRIRNNKRYLYEESARVPVVVRGPGVARGETARDVVVNADLTSTFLELSGATPGLTQDGESLLPVLTNPTVERGRALLLEAYAGPPIKGVRTSRYLYTEWDTDRLLPERELYDTYVDPFQLTNVANDPNYQPVVNELADELHQLEDCAGENCRGAPTAELTIVPTAAGKRACADPPVLARVTTSSDADVVSVSFRAGKTELPDDTVAPFEATVPGTVLRRQGPKPTPVTVRALFDDGRRLALTDNVRACK